MNKLPNDIQITLNEITLDHISDLYDIYSDTKVCKYFDFNPFENIKESEEQIKKWTKLRDENKQIRYGIFYNKKLIGTCGIYSIYWHQNRASLGYDLNCEYWNKEITTKAINLLLKELKNNYKLHRIQATLLEKNKASIKVLNKLGFTFEGTLLDYEKWKGDYVNLKLYSIIL